MAKIPFEPWAINSLWYIKFDPSYNQNLNISFKRPYKELLNPLNSFEIHHSELKL